MTRFADQLPACDVPLSVAAWARRGVRRTTLVGPDYERTAHGWYRPTGAKLTTAQRIVDAMAGMPEHALVAGWAAAYVHGVDQLDGLDDFTLQPLPVPVLLAPRQRRRSPDGVEYRQSKRTIRSQSVDGVPVTSLVRSALDLALLARDLTESVVALDAVLATGRLPAERLQRAARELTGRRGACQARRAIGLARAGVRSSWESRLRMFAVEELGWTHLQPNVPVFESGSSMLGLLGIPDLLDVEAGLALEYDGARWRDSDSGHRERQQHREDNAREERLERAGLVVVRVEKADLTTHRDRLASRLRSARSDGLRRDRSRDRWTIDEPEHWIGLPA